MSDNVTKLNTGKLNRKRIVILGVSLFVVVLLLLMILFPTALNLDLLGRRLRYGSRGKNEAYGRITFDSHSSNRYLHWKDGFLLASVGGVEIYDEAGHKTAQKMISMAAPSVAEGRNVVLCYDIGGSTVLAYKNGKEAVLDFSVDGVMLDADISDGDAICTAASESGHKTVLRVYDKNQQEIFRWFSASSFMPVCAVSDSGTHMAAVSLGQENGSFCSTLHFFATDTEQPLNSVKLGDNLVYDLLFFGDSRVCVVSEDSYAVYDLQGQKEGEYSLDTWFLDDFDLLGDGFAVLSLNMYKAGNRCSVVTVDQHGNEIGNLFVGAEILDISACGKYVAVLTTEKLMILHKDLSDYVVCENRWMATSALMREDGSVYLISGGMAELYIP